jgi:hypothetical protein
MTYREPPSKYLALWISLPIIAALAICGGVGAALGGDDEEAVKPQPVASLATAVPSSPASSSPPASSSTPSPVPPPSHTSPSAPTSPPVAPPTTRTTTETDPPPASVYYRNCTEVRAAGKAPLYRGDPGYRSGLDRDGDGVACEN